MTVHMSNHYKKRHDWNHLDGFRHDQCTNCKATRYWDNEFQRLVYRKENGDGPFFWAPVCEPRLVTNHVN